MLTAFLQTKLDDLKANAKYTDILNKGFAADMSYDDWKSDTYMKKHGGRKEFKETMKNKLSDHKKSVSNIEKIADSKAGKVITKGVKVAGKFAGIVTVVVIGSQVITHGPVRAAELQANDLLGLPKNYTYKDYKDISGISLSFLKDPNYVRVSRADFKKGNYFDLKQPDTQYSRILKLNEDTGKYRAFDIDEIWKHKSGIGYTIIYGGGKIKQRLGIGWRGPQEGQVEVEK